MPPQYESVGTVGVGASGSATAGAPSGIANDDILIGLFAENDTVAVTLPSGFVLLRNVDTSTTNRFTASAKRASSESGSYTFSAGGAASVAALVLRVSGGDYAALVHNGQANASSTNVTAPEVTPPTDGCLLIGAWNISQANQVITVPGTMTEPAGSETDQGAGRDFTFAWQLLVGGQGVGTGSRIATVPSGVTNRGILIAIPPLPLPHKLRRHLQAVNRAGSF